MFNCLKLLFLFCLYTLHSLACASLSLEEKVGQLLLVHFHGEDSNEEAKILVQEIGVGGIVYYNWANGLNSPEQVQSLSCGLQRLAKKTQAALPLFIAIDQEGGVVTRLQKGFTLFPGNKALGETHNPDLAEAAALAMGEELQAVGINLNFAPVVDIDTNHQNPVIGLRAFGEDPETVTAFGLKTLQGFKQANIIASLKHFPGHGGVTVDSHVDLPVIYKSLDELKQMELIPFSTLAAEADLIMTGHLLVPALDQENCSTLSKRTLTYLREQIGYQKAIISDSLVMEAILKNRLSVDEAAIRALEVGCDILLLGGRHLQNSHGYLELEVKDIKRIKESIVDAIQKGRLSEERLNQAFEKVLQLKMNYLSFEILENPPDLSQHVNTSKHRRIAQEIVSLSLRNLCAFAFTNKMAKEIGERIWKNECVGSLEGLTHWNQGENHASLGIGHFIWYPSDKKEQFQETFPDLLEFFKKEGVAIPEELHLHRGCPWSSREEFYVHFHTAQMQNLRQFLFDTRELQALYMARRLEKTLFTMLEQCPEAEKAKMVLLLFRLLKDPNGLYALLDYLNFKGDGTSPQEAYNGQGWGLLRVLQSISYSSKKPVFDFVDAAKFLLKQRVENSASERQEQKWLEGWCKRLDTYLIHFK